MNVQSLDSLVESSEFDAVEDAWLTALADAQTRPQQWAEAVSVLAALVKAGRADQARELAVTAVEELQDRFGPAEALIAGRAFLLALGRLDDFRRTGAELYRTAYADRAGIDRLIEESGLAGARTVRRATRTLDVCLSLEPGSCVVGRHEDTAARVRGIDEQTWRITIDTPAGAKTVAPTALADAYAPAGPDDYRVLAHFDPERLQTLLGDDPVPVVINVLRTHNDSITSDALRELLSPRFIPEEQWSKWWTRTRNLLKRVPEVRIEGRAPYVVTYDPNAATLEQESRTLFFKTRDTHARLGAVEAYLRESRSRKTQPDGPLLLEFAETLERATVRGQTHGAGEVLTSLLAAARAREARGEPDARQRVVEWLRATPDPVAAIRDLESPELWIPACECLEAAIPDTMVDQLAELLREAPMGVCDHLAARLASLGYRSESFDQLVQEIVAAPLRSAGALLWLWNASTPTEAAHSVTPSVLLNRILYLLAEIKRDDHVDRARAKAVRADARAALSARGYERFAAYLETIDADLGAALYGQISRLESLSRATREDLRRLMSQRFPEMHARPSAAPWRQEDVLYVTAQGLRAKDADIQTLVNVKMKENAKAIGQAAERGDLSENSEYRFALEERDLLRARLAQMNRQMEMARVLTPDEVPTDHVGIGSRVKLRHARSGKLRDVRVLGPWEANAEKDILNYKAPLAQTMMGARRGETVELSFTEAPGPYIVESLGNSLLE